MVGRTFIQVLSLVLASTLVASGAPAVVSAPDVGAASAALVEAERALADLAALRDAGPAPFGAYAFARGLVGLPVDAAAAPAVDARGYLGSLAPGADLAALDALPARAYEALGGVLGVHAAFVEALAADAPLAHLEALRATLLERAEAVVAQRGAFAVGGDPLTVCGALHLHFGSAPVTHDCDVAVSVAGFGQDTYLNNAGGGGLGEAALAIDLGGDDLYAPVRDFSTGVTGGGWRGAGALLDLAGDDVYRPDVAPYEFAGRWYLPEGSQNGGARAGVGLLVDVEGTDSYWGHVGNGGVNGGASFGGSAALLDLGGADDHFDGVVVGLSGGVNGGANDGSGLLFHCGTGFPVYEGYVEERGGVNSGGEQDHGVLVSCGGTYSVYRGYAGGGGVNGGSSGVAHNVLVHLSGDALFDGTVKYGGVNGGSFLGTSFMAVGPGDSTYVASMTRIGGLNGGAVEGAGALVDLGGNDRYFARSPGTVGANGGAVFGAVGVLVDVGGDDEYDADVGGAYQPELFHAGLMVRGAAVNGHGAEGGCGLLLDVGGSDRYRDGDAAPWEADATRVAVGGCGARVDS